LLLTDIFLFCKLLALKTPSHMSLLTLNIYCVKKINMQKAILFKTNT